MQLNHILVQILDTGNFGLEFFSEERRDAVCELFHFDNDDAAALFRQFLQNCSVTLRIISQTKKVDCDKLRTHNIETNLMAKDLFPEMQRYNFYFFKLKRYRSLVNITIIFKTPNNQVMFQ